jgi:hypothetical protein
MKTSKEKLEYMKRYREQNHDRILELHRKYYREHREEMLAYQKGYREKQNATMTEEEREKRREYFRVMGRIYRQLRREKKNAGQEDCKKR